MVQKFTVLFFLVFFYIYPCVYANQNLNIEFNSACSKKGNINQVKEIYQYGPDVNFEYLGSIPLNQAINCNDLQIVEYLLECGANPVYRSKNIIFSPLEEATSTSPNIDLILRLKKSSENFVKYPENFSFSRLLPFASQNPNISVLKFFKRMSNNEMFETAVMSNKNVNTLKLLINLGIDMNYKTPLESAIFLNTSEVLNFLLQHGFEPQNNIKNAIKQKTPLVHKATLSLKDPAGKLRILAKYPDLIDINELDKNGQTALFCIRDSLKFSKIMGKSTMSVLQTLIKLGVDVNKPDYNNKTALKYIESYKSKTPSEEKLKQNIIEYLIQAGAK